MTQSDKGETRPATVVITDFYGPGGLQPDAETAAHAPVPRKLTFRIDYKDEGGSTSWMAVCSDIAGFVATGTELGRAEIGSAILEQLAEFRDPQP